MTVKIESFLSKKCHWRRHGAIKVASIQINKSKWIVLAEPSKLSINSFRLRLPHRLCLGYFFVLSGLFLPFISLFTLFLGLDYHYLGLPLDIGGLLLHDVRAFCSGDEGDPIHSEKLNYFMSLFDGIFEASIFFYESKSYIFCRINLCAKKHPNLWIKWGSYPKIFYKAVALPLS